MFNAKQFCEDFNIDAAQSGKHFRPGWVNIPCPFCAGHGGYHGGFNVAEGYYNCHRCGFHPLEKTIEILTKKNYHAAKAVIKKYSISFHLDEGTKTWKKKQVVRAQIILPDTIPLTIKAKEYLISRNYDPDKLAQIWGILSTGHIGLYKHRIFAPIYQNYKLVSYQCRDITGKHPQKYLACNQNEEIIQHQHCIYGLDQAVNKSRKCIVVEGITDAWRLGIGAIAVFGISFAKQQARLIASNFDTVFIMFDSEPQAQEKAGDLAELLDGGFSNSPKITNLPFLENEIDPGDLPQNVADEIMKEIGL